MKNLLLISWIIVFATINSLAQSFESGAVILASGDTLRGAVQDKPFLTLLRSCVFASGR